MNATIIGAGNIGRGFLGQLFAEAAAAITFVELDETIVAALNERGGYDIRIVGNGETTFHVPVERAIRATDRQAVAASLASADVAATAVGAAALPAVAELVAAGLTKRFAQPADPLNVVVCENVLDSGSYLASLVEERLEEQFAPRLRREVGFATSVVSRMVPTPTAEQRRADPLAIAVEPYCILPVDAAAFLGQRLAVPGFRYVDNIDALEDQKAYTHNAGHAMVAYLGHLRGHTYIWQATEDADVRATVEGALDETSHALVIRHGVDPAEQREHVEDLFGRYRNRGLGDTVARVARQPIRKLGRDGRLVGSALLALEYDITPTRIIDGIVAALRYDELTDEDAAKLQTMIAERGIEAVLGKVCGLDESDWLAREIATCYRVATKGTAP